jgi:uroporphyrinogen-III decarboxylase
MYGLERLIGSENFALWSVDCAGLLLEAIEVFSQRICDHAKAALAGGVNGVFGWVGPELCIPPLMSPSAFDKFVYPFDKKLIKVIHNGGGRVWVHCHGKMKPVIERFAEMGVDALNPIEPPPMGDVTMDEAFGIVGDRMALEGNIESHDLMTGTKEELRKKIHETLDAGRGKRLILCPSSAYAEHPNPTPQEIENWIFYIDEGVRYADKMAEK